MLISKNRYFVGRRSGKTFSRFALNADEGVRAPSNKACPESQFEPLLFFQKIDVIDHAYDGGVDHIDLLENE